ncbi:helix-turn-helix transcriptional regulator [Saccharothrix longispora]|uniref:Transcriptional regulator with XRE-family HTH domain n=1 Tax=Saccharothrix longispora TaxID=33920 RepID=A0ABU1PPT8_9PSEU|nr:helix-turn-helix transcriptional regulator [Saccharothrix longispora]MDR6592476.1 transcriptional regulator with XRE-family HTH domain [Saccharothrix longispora]
MVAVLIRVVAVPSGARRCDGKGVDSLKAPSRQGDRSPPQGHGRDRLLAVTTESAPEPNVLQSHRSDGKARGVDASAGMARSDGEDVSSAAASLASEIKRRRVEAGLSQPQLARRIGYTRQYVSYAERVRANLPSLEIVRAIDSALEAGGVLVALRGRAKEEQNRVRRAAGRRGHDGTGVGGDVDRREFLGAAAGVALGASDVFRSSSGGVGGGDVDRLVARTARLRRLDNYLGGRDTYRLYASELEGTMSFVRQARCTGAIRKRLVGWWPSRRS